MPEYQVRAYVDECLEAACLGSVQRNSRAKIMSAFPQHEEQCFRLSYISGNWKIASKADDDKFSFEDEVNETVQIKDDEIVGVEEQKANRARSISIFT